MRSTFLVWISEFPHTKCAAQGKCEFSNDHFHVKIVEILFSSSYTGLITCFSCSLLAAYLYLKILKSAMFFLGLFFRDDTTIRKDIRHSYDGIDHKLFGIFWKTIKYSKILWDKTSPIMHRLQEETRIIFIYFRCTGVYYSTSLIPVSRIIN